MATASKTPALTGIVGSVLGLVFASYSTVDYAQHLDRRLHDVHCSLIPGMTGSGAQENPCRAAMYSAYAALFRDKFWGGIPISLFAVGAFAFFLGFALYLALAGSNASRRTMLFYWLTSLTPLAASIVMLVIALTKLGSVCRTCMGIYLSSALLAVSGWWSWRQFQGQSQRLDQRRWPIDPYAATDLDARAGSSGPPGSVRAGAPRYAAPPRGPTPQAGRMYAGPAGSGPANWPHRGDGDTARTRGDGSWMIVLGCLALLGVFSITPALVYASMVPDERPFLRGCGKIEKLTESHGALLKMKTARSVRPATLFEDPLCPTCKAFHQRLVDEGAFDKLDAQLALFPLDNECNWMLSTALHPGACLLSRAVICGGDTSRQVLEWAYDEQEDLAQLGKSGLASLRTRIVQRWGPHMNECLDSAATKLKLSHHLHFAAANSIPASTPQLYLGELRVCDEDTDLGLRYALTELAPELLR